ncbi:TPA: phage portal protein [Vibrio cholerae]|nr:phage portal protein [Vibrio cholerae]
MLLHTKSESFSGDVEGFVKGKSTAVNHDTALSDSTVQACIRIIAQTISVLPLKLYKQTPSINGKEWHEENNTLMSNILTKRPNVRQTSVEFIEQLVTHLVLYSEYFAIIKKSPKGQVISIQPFNSPKQVTVIEAGDSLTYECVTNDGKSLRLKVDEILHIKDLSLDTFQALDKIKLAKSAIGLSLSATKNAEDYYLKGSRAGGFILSNKTMSDEAYARLSKQFNDHFTGAGNAHTIGILEDGLSYKENTYNLRDSQVLETRNSLVREIASIFRVPVSLLGLPDPTAKSDSEVRRLFYTSCLQSVITKIEARLQLILPSKYYLRFDTSEYLRGDPKTQSEVVDTLFTRGLISRNEARVRLGLQPDVKDDIYVVSSNNLVFGGIGDFTNKDVISDVSQD